MEFLAGNRIRGTSTERNSISSATFKDNYDDTSSWAKTGTTVTVDDGLAGKAFGNGNTANGYDYVSKAIGTTLSDTTWTTTFDFIIDSNADYYSAPILFTAGSGNPHTSNQDAIGYGFNGNSSGDAQLFWMWKVGSGSFSFISTSNYDSNMLNLVKGQQYYVTLTRTLSNNITVNVYTNEARTSQVTNSPHSYALDSSIGGLTHVTHAMSPDTGNDQAIFTVDNMKIYDGVTTAPNPVPVVDGSIFYETDNNKSYVLNSGTWTEL